MSHKAISAVGLPSPFSEPLSFSDHSTQSIQQEAPAMPPAFDAITRRNDAHLLGVPQTRAASLGRKDNGGQRHGMDPPCQRHRVCKHDALAFLDLEISTRVDV